MPSRAQSQLAPGSPMRPTGKPAAAPEQLKVPIGELLTPAFPCKRTHFSTADAMLRAGGFAVEGGHDFASIPREHLNTFVRSVSPFANWEAMLRAARTQWMLRRMGLIFED